MTNRGPNDGRTAHRRPKAPKPESLPVQQDKEEFEVETLFQDDVTPLAPPPIPADFAIAAVAPVQGARSK